MVPEPRVYRMKTSQHITAVVLLAVGIVLAFAIWSGWFPGLHNLVSLEWAAPIVYLMAAAIFAMRAFRNQVRLTGKAIELRDLSGTFTLPFDKIKGRRRYLIKGGENSSDEWHLVLEPNDDRYPKLDFEERYRFDAAFFRWLDSLPELDRRDAASPED